MATAFPPRRRQAGVWDWLHHNSQPTRLSPTMGTNPWDPASPCTYWVMLAHGTVCNSSNPTQHTGVRARDSLVDADFDFQLIVQLWKLDQQPAKSQQTHSVNIPHTPAAPVQPSTGWEPDGQQRCACLPCTCLRAGGCRASPSTCPWDQGC